MAALNRYFASTRYDIILNTIKNHLNVCDFEISNKVDEYLKEINIERDEHKFEFENVEESHRKIKNKEEVDKFLDKKTWSTPY